MKSKWEYSNVDFVVDKYNEAMLRYSPWSGHRRFGYDLISYYQPEIVVELGSFYGCSAFAFMQAIRDNHLNTRMYPVDLWEAGDSFTLHDYEQDIYSFFVRVKEKEFSDINVEMLKMTFDSANKLFEEKSIDILHIDGSHAYEDVKHDFELWLSKVKDHGIILFHDVSEQLLYGETLGSCRFWKEIQEKYEYTVEMQFSWGLGVLFLDKGVYEDFISKISLDYYLKLNSYEEAICKDRVRKDYFEIEDKKKWIKDLEREKKILEADNQRLVKEIEETKRAYEHTLKNNTSAYENQIEKIKADYERTIYGKDQYISELERKIHS